MSARMALRMAVRFGALAAAMAVAIFAPEALPYVVVGAIALALYGVWWTLRRSS